MLDTSMLAAAPPASRPPQPPGHPRARRRSMSERDEFGALDGAPGLFRATLEPAGLHAREDLGHALCAWLPREDLL